MEFLQADTLWFMAIYICRWPNGEFSIVAARTKSDAIELLDEWGNAEQASLKQMPDCMFDFRLDDSGQIELAQIGEAAHDYIMETCYPGLGEVLMKADWDDELQDHSAKGYEQIRAAVEHERNRLWDKQPPGKDADTALGRDIQQHMGASSVVANRAVRRAAKKRLLSDEGEGKKPN